MNIQKMMKQAQEMQARLQKELAETEIEATAGGGMVTVVMNGVKQVRRITIDPRSCRRRRSRCCRISSSPRCTTHTVASTRRWPTRWAG